MLLLWIIIGALGAVVVALAAALINSLRENQKLRRDFFIKIESAQISAREDERERIAFDIHDNVNSEVWAIKLSLQCLLSESNANFSAVQSINRCLVSLDELLLFLKEISNELSSRELSSLGLSAALKKLCGKICGPHLTFELIESNKPVPIDTDRSLNIFRIVQEVLNNIIKHSAATHVRIEISWIDCLLIVIIDNGTKFSYNLGESTTSFLSIRHRLKILGGEMESESTVQNVTRLSIPLFQNKQAALARRLEFKNSEQYV